MSLSRGQRLRLLRRMKGVEQQEAAAAIGISGPYLSLLERDMKGRNVDHLRGTLERAAAYYGVMPEYLVVDTPQEYMRAFAQQLRADAPTTFGQRLNLVLQELRVRWGEAFSQEAVAATLGMTVDQLNDLTDDKGQITDQLAAKISEVVGVPVPWLIPMAVTPRDPRPEVQQLVEYAMDRGMDPKELQLIIDAWLVTKKQKPSG